MFTLSRLRHAVVTGGIFFAAFWIVQDLLNGIGADRLIKTAVMAIGFGVLDATFGFWWREKWMAMFHPSIRKRIVERTSQGSDTQSQPWFRDIIAAIRTITRDGKNHQ